MGSFGSFVPVLLVIGILGFVAYRIGRKRSSSGSGPTGIGAGSVGGRDRQQRK